MNVTSTNVLHCSESTLDQTSWNCVNNLPYGLCMSPYFSFPSVGSLTYIPFSVSSTPPAVLSALATLTHHDRIFAKLEWSIAETAQVLMVVSGLPFSAIPDLPDEDWFLFHPPGPVLTAVLRDEHHVAVEQGLDHGKTLVLVCELRDLGVRLEDEKWVR